MSLDLGEPPADATGIKIPESISLSMDSIRDISTIVKLKDIVCKSVIDKVIASDNQKGDTIEYYL